MTEELITYLKRRAGEYLRTVTVYDQHGFDVRYLRDDIAEDAARERIDEAYRTIQSNSQTALDDELGEQYATLRIRERAVILHLPRSTSDGCFVSLDPEAGRQLTQFVTECMERTVDDATPPFGTGATE